MYTKFWTEGNKVYEVLDRGERERERERERNKAYKVLNRGNNT